MCQSECRDRRILQNIVIYLLNAYGVTTHETVTFLGDPEMETARFSKAWVQRARRHNSESLTVRCTKREILHGQVCCHFFFIYNGL
jgi:hypothetical protein